MANIEEQTSEDLAPIASRFEIKASNMVFDINHTRTEFPIIDAVLQAHPYYYMLSREPVCPLVYLHQLWTSLDVGVGNDGLPVLMGTVANEVTIINVDSLRRTLRLPEREAYEATPSRDEIAGMITQLGYNGIFPDHVSSMTRGDVAAMWCTVLTVANKCTTWKHTGYDKHSTNTISILLAIAFDRHYDVARMIFNEMVQLVNWKFTMKAKPVLPFPRFFAMIIEVLMHHNDRIPRREHSQLFVSQKILKIGTDVGNPHIIAAPIPEHLLARLDPELAVVRDYRIRVAQMPPLPPGAIDPRNPPPAPRGPRAPAPRAHRAPAPQRQRAPQPRPQAPAPPILQRGPGPNLRPRGPQPPPPRAPLPPPIHPAPHRPRHIPPQLQLQPRPAPLLLPPPPLPIPHPDQPSSSTAIPPQASSQNIPTPRPISSFFQIDSDSSDNTPPPPH